MEGTATIGSTLSLPIVCLCGSAGTLDAYSEILTNVLTDTGMAFFVLSHRGKEFTDMLLPLLSKRTHMPVREIVNEMRIEPNTVFLAPPHQRVTTDGISLHLQRESKAHGWPTLITDFLRSIPARGARTIAVILSGMGDDGSAALDTVRTRGGCVIAQSNPQFNSMPLRAIDTGNVDMILSPSEIGRHLSRVMQCTNS